MIHTIILLLPWVVQRETINPIWVILLIIGLILLMFKTKSIDDKKAKDEWNQKNRR